MAFSGEASNKTWQRVFSALTGGLAANQASPAAVKQFRDLKLWMSTYKGNADLQFVGIGDLTADAVICGGACTVYGIFLRKQDTSTACWFKASDHATATSATAPEIGIEMNAAKQEHVITYPNGYAQGTGFTVGADTTADGSTSTTSGDGPNGFVIIGA